MRPLVFLSQSNSDLLFFSQCWCGETNALPTMFDEITNVLVIIVFWKLKNIVTVVLTKAGQGLLLR